jgi:pimeloyl-ACP methyl ester carboxylesterase
MRARWLIAAGLLLVPALIAGIGWSVWRKELRAEASPEVEASAWARDSRPERGGVPHFTQVPCWVQLPGHQLECGTVSVPLGAQGRGLVQLAVLRILARSADGQRPLVFLGGGPGHSVIDRLPSSLRGLATLAQRRDVVVFDPRGTGHSRPTLECRGAGSLRTSLESCFERHSTEYDPSEFTTAAGVRDLEMLRRSWGYERWDVLATSYGTRWALTLLRDAPGAVGSLVLDSPVPLQVDLIGQMGPNAHGALQRVLEACAERAACAQAFPALGADLNDALLSLRAGALRAGALMAPSLRGGSLGTASSFAVGELAPERFLRVLVALLYTPEAISYLPLLIHQAARGEFGMFSQLERALGGAEFFLGAHLSVQCAEEVPFTSAAAVAQADESVPQELRQFLSGASYLEDCALWRVRPAPALENEAVRADVRALVFSGQFDPVTPSAYADRVHRDLSGSRLLVVKGGSHRVGLTDCGLRLVDAFLTAPQEAVDAGCFDSSAQEPILLKVSERLETGTPLLFRTAPPTESELAALLAAL